MLATTFPTGKIIDFKKLQETLSGYKSLRIVQCHGVFDLLHIGHIRHFKEAKRHGDILIVTITPDHYVNKGPGRPHFTATLRAEAIAALDCVDFVIINNWPTAIEAIQQIKPHVYVKGAEYQNSNNDITGKIIDEAEAVRMAGGKVVFTDDITFSSSSLINRFFSPFSEEVDKYLDDFKSKYNINSIFDPLKQAKNLKVLVVGEAIIDIYHFSEVLGKAGKEPTLVAKEQHSKTYAGGVLALANHLSDFCKEIACLTYLGENAEYEDMIRSSLKPNIKMVAIYKNKSPTIVKRRYVEEYLLQKLFEVYEINDDYLDDSQNELLQDYFHSLLANHDLTIVADYGHGLLDENSIKTLTNQAKFLAVNTQANAGNNGFNCISKYPKADFVSIATRELQLNYRQKHLSVPEQLQKLMQEHDYHNVMITCGKNGVYVNKQGESACSAPAFVNTVVDRVGAGDAVFALSAIYSYLNADSEIIAFVGNVVGAEAVGIIGNESYIEKVSLMKHISHLLK